MENNAFQLATLTLIDEAFSYLQNDKQVELVRKQMSQWEFAESYQVLKVQSHRRAGHSTLINRLAFDVGHEIGRRYSTLVMAPNQERARYNYQPDQMYFNSDNELEDVLAQLGQEYAEEYVNVMRHDHNNRSGKVLAASSFEHLGFNARFFLEDQRKTIHDLTGATVNKFDLMLIDGASDIKPKTMDRIVIAFSQDVELFVLLQ